MSYNAGVGRTIKVSLVTDLSAPAQEERARLRSLRPAHIQQQLLRNGMPPETDVCFYCPRYFDTCCKFGTNDWDLLMNHFNTPEYAGHFAQGDTIQCGKIKYGGAPGSVSEPQDVGAPGPQP